MATRIIIFLVLILGLVGCGTLQPSASGTYGYGAQMTVYPATIGTNGKFVVNTTTPLDPYAFNSSMVPGAQPAYIEPDGRWNIAGFVQATPPAIIGNGASVASSGTAAMYTPQIGGSSQQAIQALSGLRPDQAKAMRVRLEATRDRACSSNRQMAVGALIGGVIGGVLTGDGFGAAFGALLGLAGGHGEVQASCQNWHDMYTALLTVEGQSRCMVKTQQVYSSAEKSNEVAGSVECQDITPYASTVTPPQIPTYRSGQAAAAAKPVVVPPPPARGAVTGGPTDPPLPPK